MFLTLARDWPVLNADHWNREEVIPKGRHEVELRKEVKAGIPGAPWITLKGSPAGAAQSYWLDRQARGRGDNQVIIEA